MKFNIYDEDMTVEAVTTLRLVRTSDNSVSLGLVLRVVN